MEIRGKDLKLDPAEIRENRKMMFQRFSLYRDHGYDQIRSREFIVNKAGSIKGSVLEIGTGKGYLAVLLAKKTKNLTTADISRDEQRFAALNAAAAGVLRKICFTVCDAGALPYPDNSFDLVISANAFHHFKRPFEVLREMMRVCKKKLVIADFNDEGFEIIRKIHTDEGRKHEEHHGDFAIVGAYLKEHGFSVKRSEGYCQTVYVAKKNKEKGGD